MANTPRTSGVFSLGALGGDRAGAIPTFPTGSNFKISNGTVTGATYNGSGPTGSGYSSYWDTTSGSNYFSWTPSNASSPNAFTVIVDFETTNTNAYKMLASFDISHPSQRASFHANNVGEISWYDAAVKSFGLSYSANTRYVAIAVYNGTNITGYLVDTAAGTTITSADITAAKGTSTVTPSYTSSWNSPSAIGRSAISASEWLSGQVYGGAYWPSALTEAQLVDAVNNIRGNSATAAATRPTRRWGGMTGRSLVESTAAGGDANWNDVTLLLRGDNSTLEDISGSNHTSNLSWSGTPTYATGKYGGAFDLSASSRYLNGPTTTQTSDFQFGTGDFTIESWVYLPSYGLYAGDKCLFETRGGGTGGWVWFFTGSGSSIIQHYFHGGVVSATSNHLSLNTWHHVALVRSGSNITFYRDGLASGGASNVGSTDFSQGTGNGWRIGIRSDGQEPLTGLVDDFRVTKGVARDIAADWTAGVYNSALPQGAVTAASTGLPTTGVLSLPELLQVSYGAAASAAIDVLVVGAGSARTLLLSGKHYASGGNGGSIVRRTSFAVSAGTNYAVTVGTGATSIDGASGAFESVGADGGSTRFGSLTAVGGVAQQANHDAHSYAAKTTADLDGTVTSYSAVGGTGSFAAASGSGAGGSATTNVGGAAYSYAVNGTTVNANISAGGNWNIISNQASSVSGGVPYGRGGEGGYNVPSPGGDGVVYVAYPTGTVSSYTWSGAAGDINVDTATVSGYTILRFTGNGNWTPS